MTNTPRFVFMTDADAASHAASRLLAYQTRLRYDTDLSATCAAKHLADRLLTNPESWDFEHHLYMANLHARSWAEAEQTRREVLLTIRELHAIS